MRPFKELVLAIVGRTPVVAALKGRVAVVLERIARGAGMTKWYSCCDEAELRAIAGELRPGSVVSFYFDGRIAKEAQSSELEKRLSDRAAGSETMIGFLKGNGIDIDMSIASHPEDVAEIMVEWSGATIFYGEFPARDNDGVNAVTIELPDADGAFRGHPH
jgi:hypothetical protein